MRLNFKSLPELLAFNIKYYRYLNGYSQEKLAKTSSLEIGGQCIPLSISVKYLGLNLHNSASFS